MAEGSHSFTATATDAAGNVSAASSAYTLTVDTTAPNGAGAAVITGASDNVDPVQGNISSGGSTNDTTPTLTGTAEANSLVTITDGSTVLGSVTADGSGNWSYTPSALAEGSHSFTVTATDAAGNVSAASSAYALTVDMTAPAVPTLDLPTLDDTGSSNTDNITGKVNFGLQGTAEPGSMLEILRPDGSLLGSVQADVNGNWTLSGIDLNQLDGDDRDGVVGEDGPYTFTAVARDAAGNRSAAGQLTVNFDTRGTLLDLPDAFDTGFSQTDNLTNATVVTLEGQAPVGSDVRILRPDGGLLATVRADENGKWSLPNVNLRAVDGDDRDGILGEDGPYTFRAEIPQANGGAISAGNLTVSLDTTPPATPLALDLQTASDTDTGNGAANPNADNVTADASPSFDVVLPSGPGVDVQAGYVAKIVYRNSTGTEVELGSATLTQADVTAGKVSINAPELTDGDYALETRLYDQAGNFRDQATLPVTIVTDLDGVMPSTETAVRGGDFNQDGIQDYLQSNVATFPMTNPTVFNQGGVAPQSSFGAIIAGDLVAPGTSTGSIFRDEAAQLAKIQILSPSALWAKIGVDLSSELAAVAIDPVMSGLLDFSIKTKEGGAPLTDLDKSQPGIQTRVVLELPQGVTADTFYKIGPTTDNPVPHIYAYMADGNPATYDNGAELFDLDGNGTVDRVVITYTDGMTGDDDLTVNGQIADPGFLGTAADCCSDDDSPSSPGQDFVGNRRANVMNGTDGDDHMFGRRGADQLDGGVGWDVLNGGFGQDTLTGGDGRDTLLGKRGRDVLDGGDGKDRILGGQGADRLIGDCGKDTLLGGGGRDTLLGGDCADRLEGGRGRDMMYGDSGNDTLLGGARGDQLFGGTGHDSLNGGGGRDRLFGESGNDTLIGGTQWDQLFGGTGNDDLNGGKGRDTLDGGTGNDTLTGGGGRDLLIGGEGNDFMAGGLGVDTYAFLATALGREELAAGGFDTIQDSGPRNFLDFTVDLEHVLSFDDHTLDSLLANVSIKGQIDSQSSIAFDANSQTLQIDVDRNGVFESANDAQIRLIGIQDVIYQAESDKFMLLG